MSHFFQEYSTPIFIAIALIIATLIVQARKFARNRLFALNMVRVSPSFSKNFVVAKGLADYLYSISEDAEIELPTDSDVLLLAQRGWRAIDTLDALMHDADICKNDEASKRADELLELALLSLQESKRLYELM
jgi:hypothetical protein